MVEKKRITSAKVKIREVSEGRYVNGEGLNPNYVLSKDGKRLSRVWIIGTLVRRFAIPEKHFYSITLDDGSSTIRVKAFGSKILEKLSEGDIIEIIGKIRKYGDEVYVTPEVAWKTDANAEAMRELDIRTSQEEWKRRSALVLNYRKQASDAEELKKLCADIGIEEGEVESILEAQESVEAGTQERKLHVLSIIEELDSGDGCDYSALIEKAGLEEAQLDETIQELLEEGSCFEPRAGKIKRV
ncbi:MAG: hypothetical protein HYW25_05545 [Candidatus Aenigmarchaeota archaeon]|nr:hypothetical protein [Candidatus Aenigmarchaeota archaeon]